jgi:hypothetical protein
MLIDDQDLVGPSGRNGPNGVSQPQPRLRLGRGGVTRGQGFGPRRPRWAANGEPEHDWATHPFLLTRPSAAAVRDGALGSAVTTGGADAQLLKRIVLYFSRS